MPECLGLYVEKNIIKYAKLSKDNGIVKVETCGLKFSDDIKKTINQIISETSSYKLPIIMNCGNEIYNYFSIINLLNGKDLKKVVETEFENYCEERKQNLNVLETRFIVANDLTNKDKLKVIHVSMPKTEITGKQNLMEANKLEGIVPLPIAITKLLGNSEIENSLIVNLEEKTTITKIVNQKVYNIETIDKSINEVLNKIEEKENSFSKAYEICKNTTIYTGSANDFQIDENPYLENIMPTLYSIIGKISEILNTSEEKIEKVYITGTASVINNIDIYFEQYLPSVRCEILRPSFIKNSYEIPNIKDYIEVNSAIALAMQGLGEGFKGINFVKDNSKKDGLFKLGKRTSESKILNKNIENDFSLPITNIEKHLLRTLGGCFLILLVYVFFAMFMNAQVQSKNDEISIATSKVDEKIKLVDDDITKVSTKSNNYTTAIDNLKKLSDEKAEILRNKKAIPILLSEIMDIIPKQANLVSIENTSGKKITIVAQSEKYEYLGYLKAKIKADNILTNVVSSSGQKQDGFVSVTIEGELP